MRNIPFGFEEDKYSQWLVRTCSGFQSLCVSMSLSDRVRLRGRPYGKAYSVAVFENSWTGKINPFWIKIFRCRGDEVSFQEAEELFAPQARIPLDQRPSQDKRPGTEALGSKGRKRKQERVSKDREQIVRSRPNTDYSRSGTSTFTFHNGAGNGGPSVVNNHVVSVRTTTKNSVSTPNFKKLKKRDLPWNPYSQSYFDGVEQPGSMFGTNGNDWTQQVGYIRGIDGCGLTMNSSIGNIGTSLTGTANAALVKALNRAKDMSVNLAQTMAERKQAETLVCTSLNRILNLAVAIRNGNFKRAKELSAFGAKRSGVSVSRKRHAVWNHEGTHVIGRRYVNVIKRRPEKPHVETFANLWLEYSYGWKPMLSDIYGSMELLANTFYKPKATRVSATHEIEKIERKSFSQYGEDQAVIRKLARSKVVLEFLEPTEWTNTLSKTGLSNPALLAWELVPYSFVVDWFIPIGNYLSSIDAAVGLNFTRGSTSTITEEVYESTLAFTRINPTRTFGPSGSSVRIVRRNKSRSVYATIPLPSFPVIQPNIGVEKSLSALSLLTQILTSGKTTVRI